MKKVFREDEKDKKAAVRRGAASMRDATVKMKKVTGGVAVTSITGEVGQEAKVAMLQKLSETDSVAMANAGSRTVPLELEKAAIVATAAGASPAEVEREFAVTAGYVQYALRRRYGSAEAAKKALVGLVMENALACQVHGAAHLTEMSAPQAFMSGAILIDKALALEKSMEGVGRTVDFSALAEIGRTLRVIRSVREERATGKG
jgi:hypothetical protein